MTYRRVGFWGLLWDSLRKMWAPTTAFLGAILTLLAWYVAPNAKVPVWAVVLAGSLLLVIGLGFVEALRQATSMLAFGSMKVVDVRKPHAPHMDGKCICVVEPTEPLSIGMHISFHWREPSGYERQLGTGIVVRVQEDERAQVVLREVYEGEEVSAYVADLQEGKKEAIEHLHARAIVSTPFPPESKSESTVGPDPASAHLLGPTKKGG